MFALSALECCIDSHCVAVSMRKIAFQPRDDVARPNILFQRAIPLQERPFCLARILKSWGVLPVFVFMLLM
jgi:hypothetical protein